MSETFRYTTAYWIDLYRCVDGKNWTVDSNISYVEIPREPRLAEEYSLISPDTIQRVRGTVYRKDTDPIHDLERQLQEFRNTVLDEPEEQFDIFCSSSSSSSTSASSSSTSFSSTSVSSSSQSQSSFSVSSSSSSISFSSQSQSSSSTSSSSTSSSSTSSSSSSSSTSSSSSSTSSSSISSSSSSTSSSSTSSSSTSSSSTSSSSTSQSSSSSSKGLVNLEILANINCIQSSDFPDNNPFPINEVAVATGLVFDFSAVPSPLLSITFLSDFPRIECLTNGVTTIEVAGTFGGSPDTRILIFSQTLSDIGFGGQPTFINPLAGDVSVTVITSITVFLDDC